MPITFRPKALDCCVLGLLAGLFATGCGGEPSKEQLRGTGTAKGTVSLDGKPLGSGRVILFDEADNDTAIAEIGADGTFTVKYKGGPNIPAGNYVVTIAPPPPPAPSDPADLMKNPDKYKPQPSEIPKKYGEAKSSGLKAEIKKGEEIKLEFQLQK